jgi:hypothetical protein
MRTTIEAWLNDLESATAKAHESEGFRAWLDVQSRFYDYSHTNSLLIARQCPDATKVAGYRTWQREFDRHVREGESAIWIWAPIIARRCPECENAQSYHERIECSYDETPPEAWSRGLVGFRPASVFDVSQTDGEPLPDLETQATGGDEAILDQVLEAGPAFDIDVSVVSPLDWIHGNATGVCGVEEASGRVQVEVEARESPSALAGVVLHEYGHALCHVGVDEKTEKAKREVEAEAVAYVVGRHLGLDMSNSAFYLAAWRGEDRDGLQTRLGRIARTAGTLIETLEGESERNVSGA